MIRRWLLYLTTLLGCVIFVAFYQGWLAWLTLTVVVLLPWLSLLLSLPFLLLTKPAPALPPAVTVGSAQRLTVQVDSKLVQLPWRARFVVRHNLAGEQATCKPEDFLPTKHCGQLICQCKGFYVYDLLGLFRLPRPMPEQTVLIWPVPIPMTRPRELEQRMNRSWRPKYGGGFAEHYEMRLFRPGDSLNQVHWKLTAKTKKLIVREPMIPNVGRILLSVSLCGDSIALDRKLGRLLWMGRHLLQLGLQYELQAMTGAGKLYLHIRDEQDLNQAMGQLLSSGPASEDMIPAEVTFWHCHIGGEPNET